MKNPLRLADGRTLVEQLRLQLGNVGSSVVPTILVALILVWVLSNEHNALALRSWAGAVILMKLYLAREARRILSSEISFDRAPALVWRQIVLNVIDAAIWGALAWVTLGTTTVAGSILVVAVLAGVAGSSMGRKEKAGSVQHARGGRASRIGFQHEHGNRNVEAFTMLGHDEETPVHVGELR